MHAVGEPSDRGLVLDNGGGFGVGRLAGIGQLLDIGAYLVEPSDIGRRSDIGVNELSAFPRSRVFVHFDLRRPRFAQRPQIFDHLGMRNDAVARGVTQDLLHRGNGRVVAHTGPKRFLRATGAGKP